MDNLGRKWESDYLTDSHFIDEPLLELGIAQNFRKMFKVVFKYCGRE
jgi:hypothetical protein